MLYTEMQYFWKLGILPIIFAMMKVTDAGRKKYEYSTSLCSKVKCENGGVCVTIVSTTGNKSGTHARCKCDVRFSGPRCEHEIRLKSISTTWKSAKLKIILSERNIQEETNQLSLLQEPKNPKFTLLHWANRSSDACSMIPEVHSKEHEIGNLASDMEYVICAMSGTVRWCKSMGVANSTSKSNCVVIRTSKEKPANSEFPELIIIIVLSVVLMIVVCVFIVVLMKRKNDKFCTWQKSSMSRKPLFYNLRTRKQRKREKSNDLFLPPIACDEVLESVIIQPTSSPGRPKHKLSESVRGHTSTFSAKNNKTMALTTVLEYIPNEQTEVTESLMVHKPPDP